MKRLVPRDLATPCQSKRRDCPHDAETIRGALHAPPRPNSERRLAQTLENRINSRPLTDNLVGSKSLASLHELPPTTTAGGLRRPLLPPLAGIAVRIASRLEKGVETRMKRSAVRVPAGCPHSNTSVYNGPGRNVNYVTENSLDQLGANGRQIVGPRDRHSVAPRCAVAR